jgi:hypothetical protein
MQDLTAHLLQGAGREAGIVSTLSLLQEQAVIPTPNPESRINLCKRVTRRTTTKGAMVAS